MDIVIVPDFDGPLVARFEARTLLFLASWLELSGKARTFPLHLACIGEPPARVMELARKCQAIITVFPPLIIDQRRASNKLRGLEVKAKTDQLLLLDMDVLPLSDFSGLENKQNALSAAVAIRARVPERYWKKIYPSLGLQLPEQRVVSAVGRMNCGPMRQTDYPEQNTEILSMLPYYNSGILLIPGDCQLRLLWEDHTRRIAALFQPHEEAYRSVAASDQAGLATAIQSLMQQGIPFTPLSDCFHSHWLYLYRRMPSLSEMKLFHAIGLFMKTHRIDRTLPYQVDRFRIHLMHRLMDEWRRDPEPASKITLFKKYLLPSLMDAQRLGLRLKRIFRKHVQPLL